MHCCPRCDPDDDGPLCSPACSAGRPTVCSRVRRPTGGRRVRIGYLVFNLDGMGGTSPLGHHPGQRAGRRPRRHRCCQRHPQRRAAALRHRPADRRPTTSSTSASHDPPAPGIELTPTQAALHARESAPGARRAGTASSPRCATSASSTRCPASTLDVLVTVTPGAAGRGRSSCCPTEPVVVHQEHRSSSDRTVRPRAAAALRPARRRRRPASPPAIAGLAARAARRLHPRDRDRPEPAAARLHPALAPRQPADR